MSNTVKAMFVNGSPRKQWTLPSSESHQAGLNGRVARKEGVANTAKMLESAMQGAMEAGAECEMVTNGVCAIKDDLRPVLERARQCDVLVLGSPVYYSYPTGDLRSFMERLMFPVGTYMYENGKHITLRDKVIPTAMIFTMNCPEDYMRQIGYPPILEENTKVMADIFGYSETLYACNTYQFNDYSRYDFNLFSEEDKRRYRDEHFATDLQNARNLGRRLVEMANKLIV